MRDICFYYLRIQWSRISCLVSPYQYLYSCTFLTRKLVHIHITKNVVIYLWSFVCLKDRKTTLLFRVFDWNNCYQLLHFTGPNYYGISLRSTFAQKNDFYHSNSRCNNDNYKITIFHTFVVIPWTAITMKINGLSPFLYIYIYIYIK